MVEDIRVCMDCGRSSTYDAHGLRACKCGSHLSVHLNFFEARKRDLIDQRCCPQCLKFIAVKTAHNQVFCGNRCRKNWWDFTHRYRRTLRRASLRGSPDVAIQGHDHVSHVRHDG